jgi:pimeloyl-ACP methyl ester carboxylesterase
MVEFSSSTKTVDLHYESAGSGPDVLLVHGWTSSGRMWSRLVCDCQQDFRFWSVDLPGFGQSPLPAGFQPTMAGHAAALAAFCRQREIRPRAVVGHSMGGMLALKLGLEYSDLVERLVLVCPTVTGRYGQEANRLFASPLGRFLSTYTEPFWEAARRGRWFIRVPAYVDRDCRQRMQQDFERATWKAAVTALESIARENLGPFLSQIRQPALVMIGRRDSTVPPDEGRLAARQMPNASLVEFPRAHHQLLDEEPERFVAVLREFLTAADH